MLREPHFADENVQGLSTPSSPDLNLLSKVWPFLSPHGVILSLAVFSIIIAASTVIGMGAGLQYLVDYGFSQQRVGWLNTAVLVLFLIVILMAGASYTRLYTVSWLSDRVVADLRQKIFSHLLTMDTSFFEKTSIGEIQSRLTTDTTLLQIVLGTSIPIAFRNILIMGGGVIMLLLTSLHLTGVITLLIPLILIPILVLGRRVRHLSKETQDKTAGISTRLDESFTFIRTVRAFCRERYIKDLFQSQVEEAFEASLLRVKARSLMTAVVMIFVFGGISIVLWLGGQSVLDGQMSAGQLSAFLFYAIAVAGSSGSLSEIHGDLQRAAGAAERIFELLALTPTMNVAEKCQQGMTPVQGRITFERVEFAYESRLEHLVFQDLNLEIEPGETVALVGPSGAGKTTLFSLLLRFYDPLQGQILLDGVDIKDLAFDDLRASMALVPQEPALFSTTILENIRFGNLHASPEDIIAAAKSAYAHEFIEKLPQGYDTSVGEKGIQLSGGQRQRISIARAILKDPKILLLDEATSALDTHSEQQVQKAVEALMNNRTTLVIAHRLSTVQKADRILVLDQGKIISGGPHQDLMNQSGFYQTLAQVPMVG